TPARKSSQNIRSADDAAITLRVRAEQRLARGIEGAIIWNKRGIGQASIVKGAVPSASLPPLAPGGVIAVLANGVSGLPGCAKQALPRIMVYVPGHCGAGQHGKADCGGANQSKFRDHTFLLGSRLARTPSICETSCRRS